jgi:hypothetical protein
MQIGTANVLGPSMAVERPCVRWKRKDYDEERGQKCLITRFVLFCCAGSIRRRLLGHELHTLSA